MDSRLDVPAAGALCPVQSCLLLGSRFVQNGFLALISPLFLQDILSVLEFRRLSPSLRS